MTAPETLAEALRDLFEREHQAAIRCAREAARLGADEEAAALRAVAGHAGLVEDALVGLARDRHLRLTSPRAVLRDLAHAVRLRIPHKADAGRRLALDAAEHLVAATARIAVLARRTHDDDLARWALAVGRARAELLEVAELARERREPDDVTSPVSGPRLVLSPSFP